MVRGIGIDSVDIDELERLCGVGNGAFVRRTFTEAEQAEAEKAVRPAEALAGKFAVKEATFKAVGHLTKAQVFDFRIVETLEDTAGCPHITLDGPLAPILAEAGVTELLVSITNESGIATAIVLAQ